MTVGAQQAILGMASVGVVVAFLFVAPLAHHLSLAGTKGGSMRVVALTTSHIFRGVSTQLPLGVRVNVAGTAQAR